MVSQANVRVFSSPSCPKIRSGSSMYSVVARMRVPKIAKNGFKSVLALVNYGLF
jgi:hypothetical protein